MATATQKRLQHRQYMHDNQDQADPPFFYNIRPIHLGAAEQRNVFILNNLLALLIKGQTYRD
jgi:hypothetical protein